MPDGQAWQLWLESCAPPGARWTKTPYIPPKPALARPRVLLPMALRPNLPEDGPNDYEQPLPAMLSAAALRSNGERITFDSYRPDLGDNLTDLCSGRVVRTRWRTEPAAALIAAHYVRFEGWNLQQVQKLFATDEEPQVQTHALNTTRSPVAARRLVRRGDRYWSELYAMPWVLDERAAAEKLPMDWEWWADERIHDGIAKWLIGGPRRAVGRATGTR